MAMSKNTGFLPPRNTGASSSANRLTGEYELSDDLNRKQIEVSTWILAFNLFRFCSGLKRNMVDEVRIWRRQEFNVPSETSKCKNSSDPQCAELCIMAQGRNI